MARRCGEMDLLPQTQREKSGGCGREWEGFKPEGWSKTKPDRLRYTSDTRKVVERRELDAVSKRWVAQTRKTNETKS